MRSASGGRVVAALLVAANVALVCVLRNGGSPERIEFLHIVVGRPVVDRGFHCHDVLDHVPVAHLLPRGRMSE